MSDPIYIVVCGYSYEGTAVKACLATKQEAEAVAKKYRDSKHFSFDIVRVEEWRLGEINDAEAALTGN